MNREVNYGHILNNVKFSAPTVKDKISRSKFSKQSTQQVDCISAE